MIYGDDCSLYRYSNLKFSTDLDKNIHNIKEWIGSSQDILFSNLQIVLKNDVQIKAVLIAVDGLVDEKAQRDNVIRPLIEAPLSKITEKSLKEVRERLSVKYAAVEEDLHHAIENILKAQALLIIDGVAKGLIISIEGFNMRAIEEPESEMLVRGPREGFIESISVNLSLIRRRISHPDLRFDTITVGQYSQTDVVIAYVKGIADSEIVKRVKDKLDQIDIDMVNNSGTIEQLIEDNPYSIFPTVGNTERPDKAATLLMEGRIIILVDGGPVSLVLPFQFVESIKNIEDYTSRPYYASFIRLLRLFAFFLSISLPALFISAVNFNKALIPTDMLVPLIIARETVPFPLVLELFIMILMFEVVREAGVRLPKQIGTAVSIVGPLILGEVAVDSALVGAPTVIIVSISYITSFVIAPMADVIALLRIFLFFAASIFGSYGLVVALLALFTHMATLSTIGTPYMAPFSPLYFRDWKDAVIRFPLRLLKKRAERIPQEKSKKVMSVPDTEKKL